MSTPQNSHPEIKINSLYPNPTIDFLQIQGAQGKNCGSDCLTFEVIDLNGYVRLRTTIDLSTGADEVNLSDLDEQFYVIRIFSADRDFFFEDRIQKIRE
ncbi:MAG: T9SS type A sorting domain-containing protein [Bacteroidota bacterium]